MERFRDGFIGKKVTITGGIGFIGSNLARSLLELGAKITLIDSKMPNTGGNLYNIKGIEKDVQVKMVDVRDLASHLNLISNQDFLFNLAGLTSHLDSMTDPILDLQVNAEAQLSILEACKKCNPGIRIIFSSTRQIYGRPSYLPVDEKHPLNPVDVNGINKLAGEHYYLLYNQVYDLKTSVLRLTNTYGPRMRICDARQTFIGIWIRSLIERRDFEVWEGHQLRDFTYIDDCISAFLLCAMEEKAIGQIYNIGGESIYSLTAVAQLLLEVNGRGKFQTRPFPAERKRIDIGDYVSDWKLIHAALGWKPKVNLRDGLGRTLDYYKENFSHYV